MMCLLTSAHERDVFFWVSQNKIAIWDEETQKKHIGNTRGQSERYLLHFRESRCPLPRVYVGLTPGESYLAREWGKVVFNPDAICHTSVSQGSKCDVFMWVWHKKKLYGTRVGQGGFQTGRCSLHFRESRWQM